MSCSNRCMLTLYCLIAHLIVISRRPTRRARHWQLASLAVSVYRFWNRNLGTTTLTHCVRAWDCVKETDRHTHAVFFLYLTRSHFHLVFAKLRIASCIPCAAVRMPVLSYGPTHDAVNLMTFHKNTMVTMTFLCESYTTASTALHAKFM